MAPPSYPRYTQATSSRLYSVSCRELPRPGMGAEPIKPAPIQHSSQMGEPIFPGSSPVGTQTVPPARVSSLGFSDGKYSLEQLGVAPTNYLSHAVPFRKSSLDLPASRIGAHLQVHHWELPLLMYPFSAFVAHLGPLYPGLTRIDMPSARLAWHMRFELDCCIYQNTSAP